MVLDHVPGRADAVVVAGPAADPDVLGHGDLHVIHVTAVPYRFPERVREPQRQDIQDCLFAEVVVDPEHGVGRENGVEHRVQLPGTGQVVTERLLDDHTPPRPHPPDALAGVGQARPLQLPDYLRESLGRDGEVERVVAAGAALGVELVHGLGQPVECLVVGELAGYETHPLADLLPHLVPERGARVLFHRLVGQLREVLVLPVPAREADQREPRWQQPPVGQVVDRRQQLLARQVAGDAEHDEHARAGYPGNAPVADITQRVGRYEFSARADRCHLPTPSVDAAASSWAIPARRSRRCSRMAGLSRRRSAPRSPRAWASWSLPSVYGSPGTSISSASAPVICRKTPVGGPPLWYWL